jgi:sodium pump decarboxylase gamma subunit
MVTIIGFMLVIFVLLVIAFILTLFGKVMSAQENKSKGAAKVEPEPVKTVAPVPTPAPAPVQSANLIDDKELVAAITAAIAASTGTSPDKLHVKSLRQRQGNRKAWTSEALAEQLNTNMY